MNFLRLLNGQPPDLLLNALLTTHFLYNTTLPTNELSILRFGPIDMYKDEFIVLHVAPPFTLIFNSAFSPVYTKKMG